LGYGGDIRICYGSVIWSRWGTIPQPSAREADARPSSCDPIPGTGENRTRDLRIAKPALIPTELQPHLGRIAGIEPAPSGPQPLVQSHYTISSVRRAGVEPAISRLSSERINQLCNRRVRQVGIAPTPSILSGSRSTFEPLADRTNDSTLDATFLSINEHSSKETCPMKHNPNLHTIRQCELCARPFEYVGRGNNRTRIHPELPCGGHLRRCASCQTNHRRARTKQLAIEYAGGKCILCGYSRCVHVLVFHHPDPTQKEFPIASFLCCSLDTLRSEIDKCVLLCSNCHTEVHYGLAHLPENLPPHPGCDLFSSEPRQKRVPSFCADCGTRISFLSHRCQRCESLTRRGKSTKIIWPPLAELLALLEQFPRTKVAEQLGVSDTAVRKHLQRLQLED
jgi:hypothetical protein